MLIFCAYTARNTVHEFVRAYGIVVTLNFRVVAVSLIDYLVSLSAVETRPT